MKKTKSGEIPAGGYSFHETSPCFGADRSETNGRYRDAPEVREVAERIIASYHPHLREAAIAFLLRHGSWKSRGRIITGKATVTPEQWRLLCGCDLLLIINEAVWELLGEKGREVLLDHELSHFTPPAVKTANPRWVIREHDLQEFSEVVKRHGVCTGDHRRLVEAAGRLKLESLGSLTGRDAGESLADDNDNLRNEDNCFLEE